ncbi:P-loop containing nucleoside triphosphate hydrolase protein [Panaeolus papilionaceus]|nr:P-loop containing nucleoside triphosphate hydrolase protein [Panaeolus papilionaceus]
MASTSMTKYKNLEVTEPVSVVPVEEGSPVRSGYTVLIMGPTGSGKSSFIEALGLKGTSRISSNGLDGCTQTISSYHLNNVTWDGYVIYLVDSPGFADSKISEMSIVTMLQRWMKDNDTYFHRILYFTPITSIRLSGSQRQVLKTFQALSGVTAARDITIVTSMWDNIWGEHATTQAEKTYEQLRDNIWKDFIEAGAQITKFYNTEESALSVLDDALGRGIGRAFSIEDHRYDIKSSPFANNLLTDLQNRIQNLHSHMPTLQDELAHAEEQGDELLMSTLRPRLQEAENNLARFSKELQESGLLPSPPPSPPPSVLSRGFGARVTALQEYATNSAQQLACFTSVQPSVVQPNLEQQLVPAPPTPRRFVRILEILKCWGNAVGQHHVD